MTSNGRKERGWQPRHCERPELVTDLSECKKAMSAWDNSQPPPERFHCTFSSQPLTISLCQHATEHPHYSRLKFLIWFGYFITSLDHFDLRKCGLMWPSLNLVKLFSVILSQYFTYNNNMVPVTSMILSLYIQYWVGICMAKCHWMHWGMLESAAV